MGARSGTALLDERLINRFHYDGDYGTVLNRFVVQAAVGHPLTVHGTGGHLRAFVHIQDSVRCIELAVEHPPERGERVRIFNQMTEVHRVIDLARIVARVFGAEIDLVDNPRKEATEHTLAAENRCLSRSGSKTTCCARSPRSRSVTGTLRHRPDPLPLALDPARAGRPGAPRSSAARSFRPNSGS